MMRVFSGIQPTGDLHLGNYFGAIKQFVSLQDRAECLFCIVDMHAITVKHDPALLAEQSFEIAAAYVASGIKAQKYTTPLIFIQSQVPAHAEMAWILNSVARVGWLERMTQFREKTNSVPPADLRDVLKRVKLLVDNEMPFDCKLHDLEVMYGMLSAATSNQEKASVGLFTYPVLMAADILTYNATHVPVGADQIQHLNLARDIAAKFNNEYDGGFFEIPSPIHGNTARIMSLQDASKKMSKSDPDARSRISFKDTDDEIRQKIRRATADTLPFPTSEQEIETKAEIRNLISLYTEATGMSRQAIFNTFGGQGYGVFKPALAGALVALVSPIRDEMHRLLTDDRRYLHELLDSGAHTAQAMAEPVLQGVKQLIGFGRAK